jgi:hypothetical protein
MGRLRVVLRMAVTARMGEKSQVCFVTTQLIYMHYLIVTCCSKHTLLPLGLLHLGLYANEFTCAQLEHI